MDRPHVHRLDLGHVVLPSSHPRAADGACPIVCFAIKTGDGTVVVDTGPRAGHPVIDELYAPQVRSILDALHDVGVDERDVIALVNTHLHFDHCGQNHKLPQAPVWVTDEELVAAQGEFYTVAEWAAVDSDRRRRTTDGDEVAPGVRLLHTPGHTPGHQSVVIEAGGERELVVGQACYSCAEFEAGRVNPGDLHDETWGHDGAESMARLRALDPVRAHFSHDLLTFNRNSR